MAILTHLPVQLPTGAPHRFHPLLASVDALVGTGTYIKDASRFVEVANAVFLRNESGMLH